MPLQSACEVNRLPALLKKLEPELAIRITPLVFNVPPVMAPDCSLTSEPVLASIIPDAVFVRPAIPVASIRPALLTRPSRMSGLLAPLH
jgi:hypothetical protein